MKSYQKFGLSLLLMIGTGTYAQELDANLQLRPRYEYRNGFKELSERRLLAHFFSFPNDPD